MNTADIRSFYARRSHLLILLFVVFASAIFVSCESDSSEDSSSESGSDASTEFQPFDNVAPALLGDDAEIKNRYPGVAIFDFDRDGDLDFYVTSAEVGAPIEQARGESNKLFRNDDGSYVDVAEEAGVGAPAHNSSAVAACDFNNDGYQDLYIGAMGRVGDDLDYGSIERGSELEFIAGDRLYINQKNGTFTNATERWFGDLVNIRSVGSLACGDVDNDGWLDLYVGNRSDVDFTSFNHASHPGHYNTMYLNSGGSSFADITTDAGLMAPPIVMRDSFGDPIIFPEGAEEGQGFEGFDPDHLDANGNTGGDPAGETWATLFFDHDDDGDVDLWLADDGDRLKVYRNDTSASDVRFTDITAPMGIDQSGAWMGFALGDMDGDADLDMFITNIGFHPVTRDQNNQPGGACSYAANFQWGTCYHYLLRNDGTARVPSVGTIGVFPDVAWSTHVEPSAGSPPPSLDPAEVNPFWRTPTGVAAYDFGFGTAFFDYENDGDQDLYWLGAIIAPGEGPRGFLFPGYGRMLLNDGDTTFTDVTVESHLIDSRDVDYTYTAPNQVGFDRLEQRIGPEFHENGKGLAKGDLNGDGFADLIGTNSSGEKFNESGDGTHLVDGPLMVWMNGGGTNNWITLRLKGRQGIDGSGSNADGIGARVFLTAVGNDGDPLKQVQDVLGSSTFLSMNALDLTFGLGGADEVDEIEILWPSGRTQTLTDLKINQVLEIEEPEA
ncbi:MAG: CRTAC1 family protein [Dehalococcoidia bacterium]|jgi:hypothetical protein|nr:CRTAC1 family protein [Dehalococcoidia bacterium]MDP7485526.1 CRTAC1 family protein [Dehalococcoidia bacterium]